MKTVRDVCELQPNALSIKLSDQVEQLDELIGGEGAGRWNSGWTRPFLAASCGRVSAAALEADMAAVVCQGVSRSRGE